jgi:hypothetical protein
VGPRAVRDETQRFLYVKVAAVEVIQRKPDQHADRTIFLGVRLWLWCRGKHGANLSTILTCFIVEASD